MSVVRTVAGGQFYVLVPDQGASFPPESDMTVAASPSAKSAELDYRPSYLAALVAGIAVLVLYILTLAPTTSMWDTSEYITAAYTLGLPHPPGNPLFVLIGRVFAMMPIAPSVAMRINVLAAVSSAVSAAFWFLVTERVLVGWLAAVAGNASRAVHFRHWSAPRRSPSGISPS